MKLDELEKEVKRLAKEIEEINDWIREFLDRNDY